MYNFVHSIKFGTHGVLINWGTRESFVSNEEFDNHIINRVGCRVNLKSKKGTYLHFKNLQDAVDFMEWMAGAEESE